MGNMYPPHHLGGYELTWRSSVAHLQALGHEVEVLTTDYRASDPVAAAGAPEPTTIHRELRWYWRDHDFPRISLRERIALERHNARVLTRRLAAARPHVVAWWALGGMSLSLVERVRRAGIPAVGIVGDLWMLYGPQVDAWTRAVARVGSLGGRAAAAAGLPAGAKLAPAARWLFVSDYVRRQAVERVGALPGATVRHPGIDPQTFPTAEPQPWRGRLLYAGRIDERKGVRTAIEALAELAPEVSLRVVGDGDPDHRRMLAALAEDLGLGPRVALEPGVGQRELAGIYAAADVLVFPVLWSEPWGLVPLEAMATGTLVLATGTGGSGEYLRDRENCLLFEPGDVKGLARSAGALAGDPALRARLREGGLATAARLTEHAYNAAIERALLDAACA